jgi:hypothetical protein
VVARQYCGTDDAKRKGEKKKEEKKKKKMKKQKERRNTGSRQRFSPDSHLQRKPLAFLEN